MIDDIIRFPQPSLRKPCESVSWFDDDSKQLLGHVDDLRDTLASIPTGIALSSNQIVEHGYRIFVVKSGLHLPIELFNPAWSPAGEIIIHRDEGCLSIPKFQIELNRYRTVKLEWQDRSGEKHAQTFDGIEAQIVQHECDHLDGKLIIDRAPLDMRTRYRAQMIRDRKAGR